jgi:hypothetical protein
MEEVPCELPQRRDMAGTKRRFGQRTRQATSANSRKLEDSQVGFHALCNWRCALSSVAPRARRATPPMSRAYRACTNGGASRCGRESPLRSHPPRTERRMNNNQIEGKVQKGAGDVEHPLDRAASKTCSAAEGAGNGPLGLRATNDRLS